MPFRINRRKPGAPSKPLRFPLLYRLLLLALGAALAWLGSRPRTPATFMYWNWRGQPVYPNSVAPIGAVMILISLIPASWIERLFNRLAR